MINKVILIGNVGKDPEVKVFENDTKVASFSMATSESYRDKSGEKKTLTEWHNIQVWGKQADVVEKYVSQGSKLYIEGKLTTQTWEKDGVKKHRTVINTRGLVMLGEKKQEAVQVEQVIAPEEENGDLLF